MNEGRIINNPDEIDLNKELFIDPENKTIHLEYTDRFKIGDKISWQCLYSKLIDLWKQDSVLCRYPFPIFLVESFTFNSDWKFKSDNDIDLINFSMIIANIGEISCTKEEFFNNIQKS